jgi:hypothetical protein
MGLFLIVLYFVTYYLTPPVLFGPFAVARVEVIIAVLLSLISLPRLKDSAVLKTPQLLALIGLAFSGSLSVLFGVHWVSGAIRAFPAFCVCTATPRRSCKF